MKLRLIIFILVLCYSNLKAATAFTFTDHAWLGQQLLHPSGGGGGGGTLTNTLVSDWTLNEDPNTTRLDDWGANNLTDVASSVGTNTGVLLAAAQFIGGGAQELQHADNASLSFAAHDFTIMCWVKLDDLADNRFIVGKWESSGEYLIYYSVSDNRFQFYREDHTGSANQHAQADTFGAPSAGVWYMIIAGQDFSNGNIFISVNAGTKDTTPFADDGFDGSAVFSIGQFGNGGGGQYKGFIDQVDLWSRTLTEPEKVQLYNSGNARNPVDNP